MLACLTMYYRSDGKMDSSRPCKYNAVSAFVSGVNEQLWRSNALTNDNAVLVAIMVAVGATDVLQ